jgi:hypothetical protein
VRMRALILLFVARVAWAEKLEPPRCEVADPNTYLAIARETPLVKALEAKRWTVQGSVVYGCANKLVDVGVMLTPPGKPWPKLTRLTLRLGFDATPVADAEWKLAADALIADLDALWKLPEVSRFGALVGIKYAGIAFAAGRRPPGGALPIDLAGVTLMSKEFTDTAAIADATKLEIGVQPDKHHIARFSTVDSKLLPRLDAFVPGFSKHCTLRRIDKRVDYDDANKTARIAINASCPTCGSVRDCKLE